MKTTINVKVQDAQPGMKYNDSLITAVEPMYTTKHYYRLYTSAGTYDFHKDTILRLTIGNDDNI